MNRKSVFDAVRRMLGRGFTQSEVDALDDALDSAVKPDPPSSPEVPSTPKRISDAGEKLIKKFEGLARVRTDGRIEAYPDPGTGGAPWTIGWGATGVGIGPGTVWTREQADERLREDIERHARDVRKALGSAIDATSQAQFDALVSFHYNTGAIASATLTRKHIDGDYAGAANEFGRWINAGGRVMKGLVRRRKAEADLYRSGSK